jgi:hypothetical protein
MSGAREVAVPTADRCPEAVMRHSADGLPYELLWCKREAGHPGIHLADAEQGECQWPQEER